MNFANSNLLITGGTGSFGNAVLSRFLDSGLKEIRIFSRDEKKQDDMRQHYNDDKIKYYIGDVRSIDSLRSAMRGVDFAFCAAALKQVPSCEFYPLEAVRTNIIGTGHSLDAAIENQVKRVVVLSTDKAVYPINAMGMSKALMEKVVVAKSRNIDPKITTLCATRYGNVMASRGSVIPLMISQIKRGKPITVTDPKMTRFMMSLDDAIDLVIYAFENAQQGEIFVQKAPAATIGDLAEVLLEIFDAKNEIQTIGTRHGEKLYETLLSKEEAVRAEEVSNFYRIPPDSRELNYRKFSVVGDSKISDAIEFTSHNTHRLTRRELRDLLLTLDYIRRELGSTGSAE
jgi:UDP-N-acetylglucosamine 4,6-dehydratase/5-epimerase